MTDKETLAEAIIKHGWYKEGDFTLSSGRKSDYYVNLRPCMLNTKYIHYLTGNLQTMLFQRIGLRHGDLLCGVITSGLCLASAMLQRLTTSREVSAIYCRTEHRMHGTRRDIEGEFEPGQPVILIDDVATSGNSLGKVCKILVDNGLKVKAALVVVDREEGATRYLWANYKVPLFSVLTIEALRIMKLSMGEDKREEEKMAPSIPEEAVFTISQVAKICKVPPRTISKWLDSGRLKGYRIPGSQDRCIPREYLIKFLKEHGMPLGDLETGGR